jgi:hypothetical protein
VEVIPMSDDQDQAERLDDDVLADDELLGDERFEDPDIEQDYPPDAPMGVLDPGVYEIDDSVASRTRREIQDIGPGDVDVEEALEDVALQGEESPDVLIDDLPINETERLYGRDESPS